jgi:predicted flap endonuclease-1-like 5' DNA nuclease
LELLDVVYFWGVKMSTFGCCFWWLLLGALIGWLLNYLLCRCARKKTKETVSHYTPPPAPAPKETPPPATASINPVASPAPAPAKSKASTTKKAPVKPKPKDVAIDLAAAKAAGIKIKAADDLTVIEGIGPKINDLFKQNGLKTFADVASATVPQMRKILDAGGARFRIANPSTWAKQAKLAASNKWTELKKLQDELSGGIKK